MFCTLSCFVAAIAAVLSCIHCFFHFVVINKITTICEFERLQSESNSTVVFLTRVLKSN